MNPCPSHFPNPHRKKLCSFAKQYVNFFDSWQKRLPEDSMQRTGLMLRLTVPIYEDVREGRILADLPINSAGTYLASPLKK